MGTREELLRELEEAPEPLLEELLQLVRRRNIAPRRRRPPLARALGALKGRLAYEPFDRHRERFWPDE